MLCWLIEPIIYLISTSSLSQLGFMLLALIWKFDFPPFMVLIIAILNDGKPAFLLNHL
jgi:hypothetical protein